MKSINNKLSAILVASLAIIMMVVIWSTSSLWQQVHEYQDLVANEAQDQTTILQVQAEFKTQVQEWKNVLLRGADDKKREKYWGTLSAA